MFGDLSSKDMIIIGLIIALVIFGIYLFTETRSIRTTLDSMDADDDDEPEEEEPKVPLNKEEPINYFSNGANP